MPQLTMCCPQCKGAGKVKLSNVLLNTLACVGDGWQSTATIFGRLADSAWIKRPALSSRLLVLLKLKLVRCELRGHTKYWRRK